MTTAAHAAALAATIDVAGAGPVRFSSPIDVTQPVQFSRPTMVMDDEPEAPRQRRVGAGWVGARTQGGGGGGGGGQPQPQSRPETPGPISAVVGPNGQITLTWEDLSTNETGFAVDHQMLIDATWETSGTFTAGPGREQLIVTVPMGEHRFRVAAYNPGGMSTPTDWGAAVQTTDPVDVALIPLMPANVLAERIAAETVRVSWDDASANETSFEVERDPPFSDGTRTVAANVTAYEDSGADGDFRYRVRSVNEHGESGWAGWVDISETDLPPEAPGSFAANDAGNGNTIRLTWLDNSSNETSFAIERQQQVGGQWGTTTELEAAANGTEFLDPAGTGTFRYRVAARNDAGSSPWSVWATATVTAAGGWTEFTRSSDTRVVYVSSSEGNDSNDGLSEDRPKRTIAAGYAVLRHGYPDWLLLKRGDVWDESLGHWKKSGRSATERMVVNTYGNDVARPLLRTGRQSGFDRNGGGGSPESIDYLALVGIHLVPHLRTDESPVGIRWLDGGRDLLIEDCKFEGYTNNIAIQGYTAWVDRVVIRRCVIVDSYPTGSHSQGIYISRVRGLLIEENVIDRNGWHEDNRADATIYNHNMYIQTSNTDAVIRNNIITRASSHGLQLRCGGVIENNVAVQNGLGLLLGGGTVDEITHRRGVSGSVIGNVVMEGTDINSSIPRGMGIDVTNIGMDGAVVRDNIVAHKLSSGATTSIDVPGSGVGSGVGANNVSITNNIVYDWRGPIRVSAPPSSPPSPSEFSTVTNITIADNDVQDPDSQTESFLLNIFSTGPCDLGNNRYFSARPSDRWFRIGSQNRSWNQWREDAADEGSEVQRITYPDPDRSVGTYNASLGGPATLEAFLANARQQSRMNWRPEYTAEALRRYIRAGFALED